MPCPALHPPTRLEEINRKRELDASLNVKRLEIVYAGKLARREGHDAAGYLLTATSPPLYWKPAKHTEATLRLAEAGLAASAEWRAAQLEALESERQQLLARGRPLPVAGKPGEAEAREGEDAAMHEEEAQQGRDDRYAPSGDQGPA